MAIFSYSSKEKKSNSTLTANLYITIYIYESCMAFAINFIISFSIPFRNYNQGNRSHFGTFGKVSAKPLQYKALG